MIYGERAVNLVTTTTATLPIYALTTHFSLETMRLQMITPLTKTEKIVGGNYIHQPKTTLAIHETEQRTKIKFKMTFAS